MNGTKKIIIDSHCHYFNGGFALREAIAIGWNKLRGNYPYKKTLRETGVQKFAAPAVISKFMASVEGWADLLSYVVNLLKVTTQSCQGNYEYNVDEFRKSKMGYNSELITAPLMMDIYFILDNNKDEASSLTKRPLQTLAPSSPVDIEDDDELFKQYVAEVKQNVNALLQDNDENLKLGIRPTKTFNNIIDELFETIEQEFISESKRAKELSVRQKDYLSPGYKNHLMDLISLQRSNKERVFPFLAIDPRRYGIMNLIEQYINDENSPFKGIKLYPPLGYLPSHPNLVPVYEYCIKNDVPITVHTSSGGVPNFRKEIFVQSFDEAHGNKCVKLKEMGITAQAYFANPDNWIPVLNKYENLRLNFAHFGGNDQCLKYPGNDDNWTNKIINIMERYEKTHPNIYCDISYYAKSESQSVINQIMLDHPIVKKRLMFGTDYIMIMMAYKLGGLASYYNLYNKLDDEQCFENAKRFLKVGNAPS